MMEGAPSTYCACDLALDQGYSECILAPLRSVGAKEDRRLVSIDFLPKGLFIAIEDVNKLLAFLDTCFAKEKAIVGEEEMSEGRAAPDNRNTTYLLVSSGFVNES